MDGRARIVAESSASGATRLTRLFSTGTISLWPLPQRAGQARVHMVSRAAGPIAGDALRVDVAVGAGASLAITSAAAAIALPGPGAAGYSTTVVHARVAAGGHLCWHPEPLLVTAGAAHRGAVHIEVEEGGAVLWWDELVLGRTGETPGNLDARLAIDHAGTPLVRHDLRIGEAWPGWDSYAVLGPYRVHITACAAGVDPRRAGDAPAALLSPTAAVLPCDGPGVLVTAAADDLATARCITARGLATAGIRYDA